MSLFSGARVKKANTCRALAATRVSYANYEQAFLRTRNFDTHFICDAVIANWSRFLMIIGFF